MQLTFLLAAGSELRLEVAVNCYGGVKRRGRNGTYNQNLTQGKSMEREYRQVKKRAVLEEIYS